MKNIFLSFLTVLFFAGYGMAQNTQSLSQITETNQVAVQEDTSGEPLATSRSPISMTFKAANIKASTSKVNTKAYISAKTEFKKNKPNATREEINQFLKDWK